MVTATVPLSLQGGLSYLNAQKTCFEQRGRLVDLLARAPGTSLWPRAAAPRAWLGRVVSGGLLEMQAPCSCLPFSD